MRLHRELSKSLLEETEIKRGLPRALLSGAVAFTEADVRRLQAALPWQQHAAGLRGALARHRGGSAGEAADLGRDAGATLTEGGGAVEPYRLVLALTRAAEHLGVTGVARSRDRPPARRRARHRRGPGARGAELRDRGARARTLRRRGTLRLDRRADRRSSTQGPDTPSAGSGSAGRMFRRLGSQLRHDQDRRPLVGGDDRGRGGLRRGVDARGPRRDRRLRS